jgi:hypothetical protein
MEHCHSIGAQSWANIFGYPLGGQRPSSPGLLQFAQQQPGEVMIIDLTHMYDPATPGTPAFNEAAAELTSLCQFAIPTTQFANAGATPVNMLRSYAQQYNKPFLFYMATSDSDGGSTNPYAAYSAAVPGCLRSESTSDAGGGINNNSYNTSDNADPMNDYVSPIVALTSPGSDFNNFQFAQYNLAQSQNTSLPSSNASLSVSQYIWNYDPYTITYLVGNNLRDWTEEGLANSYSQDAFPVGEQFVTGLKRAGSATNVFPSIVLMDFIGDPFWGPTMAMIWNQNTGRPVLPWVTVNITNTGGVTGTFVHDTGAFNCTSTCTAYIPAGTVLYAAGGSVTWQGNACASTDGAECTIASTGTLTENVTFSPNAQQPGAPINVHLQVASATSIAVRWVGVGTGISSYTATAYDQGTTVPVQSCSSANFAQNTGSCFIDDLVSGTSYYVKVVATNQYGQGPASTTSAPQDVTPQ